MNEPSLIVQVPGLDTAADDDTRRALAEAFSEIGFDVEAWTPNEWHASSERPARLHLDTGISHAAPGVLFFLAGAMGKEAIDLVVARLYDVLVARLRRKPATPAPATTIVFGPKGEVLREIELPTSLDELDP